MSKELAFLEREEFYSKSSKELEQMAQQQAQEIIDAEWQDEVIYKATKVSKYLESLIKPVKNSLMGKPYYSTLIDVKESGRTTLNYNEDKEWLELHTKLKEREELLKMRAKLGKAIYDNDGVEVPLVSSSTTDFLTIKLKS
jgi:hypothetical protein